MDDDTEVEIVPEDYPWAQDADERRRSFVFESMASPEIDGGILLKNMDAIVQWLKTGALPAEQAPQRQRRLSAVAKDGD